MSVCCTAGSIARDCKALLVYCKQRYIVDLSLHLYTFFMSYHGGGDIRDRVEVVI